LALLMTLAVVLIVVGALVLLLRRRRPAPRPTGSGEAASREQWTRADRIAMASLVIGTVLAVVGLLQ